MRRALRATGAPGPTGPPGPAYALGDQIVAGTASPDNETAKTVTATCPGSKVAVGGGFLTSNVSSLSALVITGSYPSGSQTWTATGTVTTTAGNTSYSLQAYVVCANP